MFRHRFNPLKLFLLVWLITGMAASPVSAALKWRYLTEDYVASSPAVTSDGTVYVGSYDSYLYAVSADGSLKWKYKTGGNVASSPAVGTDGTVYVGSWDKYLYAINPAGSLKWKYQIGSYASSSSPAVGADGVIYVGSDDKNLYAVAPDGTLKWKYQTGDYISSSPAVGTDGTVYVGSNDRNLYAVNSDGTLKWKYQTESYVSSSPAVGNDGTVYVGSDDKYLYAIAADGTLAWKYKTGDRIYSSPAVGADGKIYIGSYDTYLYAVNPDGTLKWKYRTGNRIYSSPAIGSDGTVYVGSDDKKLYVIASDGTLRQKYQTGSYVSSSPVIGTDGTVYVGSDDKKLYALGDSGQCESSEPGVVTSCGGEVFSADGRAYVIFPMGATSQPLYISIVKMEDDATPSAAEGTKRIVSAYDFTATDADGKAVRTFDEAVEVAIAYSPDELGTADESELKISYHDETSAQWTEMLSEVDTQIYTVSAMSDHFTPFAVFGPIFNSPPVITSDPQILAYLNDGDYLYDVEAEDAEGDVLTFSLAEKPDGMTIDPESGLITWPPQTGDYTVTVNVSDGKAVSEQTFTLTVDPDILSPFKAGEFTVGASGIVTVDWLYDGGGYLSDLCFFSTKGMETYRSESIEFIREATRRCLSHEQAERDCGSECGTSCKESCTEECSGSSDKSCKEKCVQRCSGTCENQCVEERTQGYVVISDPFEGARYSGSLGEPHNWNMGTYKGVKSFKMKPGDKFAAMLIPNGRIQSLRNDLETDASITEPFDIHEYKRPLFSLIAMNPEYGMQMGQAVNIGGLENAIVFEDIDVETGTHDEWRDYNDLIIQVGGAGIDLPALDDVIGKQNTKRDDKGWFDWRESTELGRLIMEHIETPPLQSEALRVSVSLDSSSDNLTVCDAQKRSCGKEGCYIPGAEFKSDDAGYQRVFLPEIPEAAEPSYRITVRGTGNELRHLTLTGHKGGAELRSETKEIQLIQDQVLMSEMTAAVSGGMLTFDVSEPESCNLVYDFDGDSDIDSDDVMKVFLRWGQCAGDPDYSLLYDLDKDGCIGILDVMMIRNSQFRP